MENPHLCANSKEENAPALFQAYSTIIMKNEEITGIAGITDSKNQDPNAPARKQDHIDLAFRARTEQGELDERFFYEPLLSPHPGEGPVGEFPFLGKTLSAPIWVSSMTGGTQWARHINTNLARACRDFGMGMGLGSCRSLLYSDEYLADFNVRHLIGPDLPLFANLGIAQLEQLLEKKDLDSLHRLVDKLQADGLIIHVNPMQEWLQPEGDRFARPPIDTIEQLLQEFDHPLIVKEVGQGMGRESLRRLLQLPLAAVEFAAGGGTNFAKLEMMRGRPEAMAAFQQLAFVGHTATDMVDIVNEILQKETQIQCGQIIISGGVHHFLDGYYLIRKLQCPAVYGQASAFLKHARGDYEALHTHVKSQVEGLKIAYAYLKIRA